MSARSSTPVSARSGTPVSTRISTALLCLLRRPERKRPQGVGCADRIASLIVCCSDAGRPWQRQLQRIARSCEFPFIAAAACAADCAACAIQIDRPIALRCRVQGNATPRRGRRRVLGGLHGRRPARGRREDVPLRAAYAPPSAEHGCCGAWPLLALGAVAISERLRRCSGRGGGWSSDGRSGHARAGG